MGTSMAVASLTEIGGGLTSGAGGRALARAWLQPSRLKRVRNPLENRPRGATPYNSMRRYRRRLPHLDIPGVPTFVTWRLSGSLPTERIFPHNDTTSAQ